MDFLRAPLNVRSLVLKEVNLPGGVLIFFVWIWAPLSTLKLEATETAAVWLDSVIAELWLVKYIVYLVCLNNPLPFVLDKAISVTKTTYGSPKRNKHDHIYFCAACTVSFIYTDGGRSMDNLTFLSCVEVAEGWTRLIPTHERCQSGAELTPEPHPNHIALRMCNFGPLRSYFFTRLFDPYRSLSLFRTI